LFKVKERVEKESRSEKKRFDTNNEDQIAIIEDFLLVSDKDVLNSIDSGASNHATSWRKLFISYTLGDYGHVRIQNMFF
jgi:ABC-type phosphate/phosphonate transport system ATPase subunit